MGIEPTTRSLGNFGTATKRNYRQRIKAFVSAMKPHTNRIRTAPRLAPINPLTGRLLRLIRHGPSAAMAERKSKHESFLPQCSGCALCCL